MAKASASSVESSVALPSHWVAITFADTWAGVPKENLDKLFEPLFTPYAKGIGLELAIAQALVEANGATIKAQSEAGKWVRTEDIRQECCLR